MKKGWSIICATSLSVGFSADCLADPSTLRSPALYDNAGAEGVWGQTFVAESDFVTGVDFYIGDPTRPGNDTVNALEGEADLILYDATDPKVAVELADTQIQGAGGYTFGLTEFDFSKPIPVVDGDSYLIGIGTTDRFGIGLNSQTQSTYSGGFEGLCESDVITEAGGNLRDTSFDILTDIAPEPSIGFAALFALLMPLRSVRRSNRA